MSKAAYGESKRVRRQCVSCGARKARFRYRGVVKADRNHRLCFECFRAERDRYRARLLASVPPARPVRARLCRETSRGDSGCHEMTSTTLSSSMSTASATSGENSRFTLLSSQRSCCMSCS